MKQKAEIVIAAERLTFGGLELPDFALTMGESLMILTEKTTQGCLLVDMLLGLRDLEEGRVTLLGSDPSEMGDERRLELLLNVAHVGVEGDLISNLKAWENVSLGSDYHFKKAGEAEEDILEEGVKIAGLDDQWMERAFAGLPTNLDRFEKRLIGLLRAALLPARLLLCEFIFENLSHGEYQKIGKILDWMKERNPQLAILHIHHAPSGKQNLDLTILGHPSILFCQ